MFAYLRNKGARLQGCITIAKVLGQAGNGLLCNLKAFSVEFNFAANNNMFQLT